MKHCAANHLIQQIANAEDLNQIYPESCEGYGKLKESPLRDLTSASLRPVFRNIENELIEQIHKHDVIVGCVAWLTSIPILEALQGKEVQFVVQQEDWLRPDSSEWSMAKQRKLYQSLTGINTQTADANWSSWGGLVQPIRLSGKPKTKDRSNPRMHHKFAIFGNRVQVKYLEDKNETYEKVNFSLLWTGSYNFTNNATKSLENGLFIQSSEVVDAYRMEWRQILLASFRIEDYWWGESYGWISDDEVLRDGT